MDCRFNRNTRANPPKGAGRLLKHRKEHTLGKHFKPPGKVMVLFAWSYGLRLPSFFVTPGVKVNRQNYRENVLEPLVSKGHPRVCGFLSRRLALVSIKNVCFSTEL